MLSPPPRGIRVGRVLVKVLVTRQREPEKQIMPYEALCLQRAEN